LFLFLFTHLFVFCCFAAEPLQDSVPAAKAAIVTGLVRTVHVLIQSKPMVGETVTEEDGARCQEAIARAKALNPRNDSVRTATVYRYLCLCLCLFLCLCLCLCLCLKLQQCIACNQSNNKSYLL
jgi:hypothetical protein